MQFFTSVIKSGFFDWQNLPGDYRYGFNGMEKDDEIKNIDGSSLDFGARMYDPRIGRWFSTDQLEASYPDLSPYNYVSNNPILFIDLDGKEIILPPGLTTDQKLEIVGNLQKLTDDKLVYETLEDGSVQIKIASLGNGKKDSGTSLIRELNSSEYTITIDYNNSLQTKDEYGNLYASNENWTKSCDPNTNLNEDGSANIGGDVIVNFAPEQLGGQLYETNPVTLKVESVIQKNMQIILGHEMIHAEHMIEGTNVPYGSIDKVYYNYFLVEHSKLRKEAVEKEEMRTVGLGDGDNTTYQKGDHTENQLRKEAGLNARGAYNPPPKK